MKSNYIPQPKQRLKRQNAQSISKSYRPASKNEIRSGIYVIGLLTTFISALGFTFYGNTIFSEKIALCLFIIVGILFIKVSESNK